MSLYLYSIISIISRSLGLKAGCHKDIVRPTACCDLRPVSQSYLFKMTSSRVSQFHFVGTGRPAAPRAGPPTSTRHHVGAGKPAPGRSLLAPWPPRARGPGDLPGLAARPARGLLAAHRGAGAGAEAGTHRIKEASLGNEMLACPGVHYAHFHPCACSAAAPCSNELRRSRQRIITYCPNHRFFHSAARHVLMKHSPSNTINATVLLTKSLP